MNTSFGINMDSDTDGVAPKVIDYALFFIKDAPKNKTGKLSNMYAPMQLTTL